MFIIEIITCSLSLKLTTCLECCVKFIALRNKNDILLFAFSFILWAVATRNNIIKNSNFETTHYFCYVNIHNIHDMNRKKNLQPIKVFFNFIHLLRNVTHRQYFVITVLIFLVFSKKCFNFRWICNKLVLLYLERN